MFAQANSRFFTIEMAHIKRNGGVLSRDNILLTQEEMDEMKAIRSLYLRAANDGHMLAQRCLAELLASGGYGLSKANGPAAFQLYLKAAIQGDTISQCAVGSMYLSGKLVRRNDSKALRWFIKAAKQDDAFGQFAVAQLFANGGSGVKKSNAIALHYLRHAAQNGLAEAQAELGAWYLNGREGAIVQDDQKAEKWLVKAAQGGSPFAKEMLTDINAFKKSFTINILKSPEHQYKEAMSRYNTIFEGIIQTEEPAAAWTHLHDCAQAEMNEVQSLLRESAYGGFASAMFTLGVIYENGQGVRRDPLIAQEWYQMAALEGDLDALAHLSEIKHSQVRRLGCFSSTVKTPKV